MVLVQKGKIENSSSSFSGNCLAKRLTGKVLAESQISSYFMIFLVLLHVMFFTVMDVDYAPTGKEFVTAGYDKTVRIFAIQRGHSRLGCFK